MKLKFLLAIAVASFAVLGAKAQQTFDERYGADPAKREENAKMVSFMKHAYDTKSYNDALFFFRKLIVEAPKASINMYIWATDIYRGRMMMAETKAERNTYLDSVLMVYDMRIENFADHAKYGKPYLTAQKAYLFSEENSRDITKMYDLFRQAVEAGGKDVDSGLVLAYFNSLTSSYKLDDVTADEYLSEYERLVNILAVVNDEDNQEVTASMEGLFAMSGAASCENIEKIFRPRYEADPNNVDLIKKILTLFTRSKCGGEFQLAITEKFYAVEPTPELAAMLGSIYETRKDYKKALEYITVAVASEKDPDKKQSYLLSAANSSLASGNARDAADLAKQAIAINDSKAGVAYLILAQAYADGINACSGFERQAAYWLIVDVYIQARSRMQDQPAQLDMINKAIGSYSASFPKVDETFQRDLNNGDGYTVSCGWVNGRTTVRER